MNWIQQLELIDKNEDFREVIQFYQNNLRLYPQTPDLWIRMLYVLHDVIEEKVAFLSEKEKEEYVSNFRETFGKAIDLFQENSKFSFYMGAIGRLANWVLNKKEIEKANLRAQKAFLQEESNILYEWGTLNSLKNKEECSHATQLAKKIQNNPDILKKLKEMGLFGRYLLEVQIQADSKQICLDNGIQDNNSIIGYKGNRDSHR